MLTEIDITQIDAILNRFNLVKLDENEIKHIELISCEISDYVDVNCLYYDIVGRIIAFRSIDCIEATVKGLKSEYNCLNCGSIPSIDNLLKKELPNIIGGAIC